MEKYIAPNVEDFPIEEADFYIIPLMGNQNMNMVIEVDTNLGPGGLSGLQTQVDEALRRLGTSLDAGEVESGAIVGNNNVVFAILKRVDAAGESNLYGIVVDGGLKRHYYKRKVRETVEA